MAQTSSPFTLPDFSYPLPKHRRTFQSIWGVTFVREYLRALNLKPSSKHVRQALESFGRDLPEAEYSKMFGMLVTLKDRFGRKREFHFLNQFWRWQNIEHVYPEFNQHPELLGQVTMGTYTPELDRSLTENNIKLWKLTGLMIETDVPNGPDKATLRVLMGLAWIEALLDESRTFSHNTEGCFPAFFDFQDYLAFTQGKLPVVMLTTWPTVGAFIRRAVRVPKKSLSREVAREKLLNISYKPNPTEDRFSLLMPKKLEVDRRVLNKKFPVFGTTKSLNFR